MYRLSGTKQYWHGTDSPIDGKIFNLQGTTYFGIYASSDKNYALEFGRNLIPVNITLNNPLQLDLDDKNSLNYASPSNGEIVLDGRIIGFYRKLTPHVVSILQKNGYDGITVKYRGVEDFEVVAFDPSQVHALKESS